MEGGAAKDSLEGCLESFTKNEVLDKENTWYCSKCKDHMLAEKQIKVHKLPQVLIVHLKRFSSSMQYLRKDNNRIEYPVEGLDMRKYLVDPETPGQTTYDLFGVINHSGGLSSGHYTSYVKSPYKGGTWVHFDDESVQTLETRNIVTQYAYVLFYRKRAGPSSQ